jgi:hypothetical protein
LLEGRFFVVVVCLFETGSHHIVQADFELLDSSDLPASTWEQLRLQICVTMPC